jgi:hypothetical protein
MSHYDENRTDRRENRLPVDEADNAPVALAEGRERPVALAEGSERASAPPGKLRGEAFLKVLSTPNARASTTAKFRKSICCPH